MYICTHIRNFFSSESMYIFHFKVLIILQSTPKCKFLIKDFFFFKTCFWCSSIFWDWNFLFMLSAIFSCIILLFEISELKINFLKFKNVKYVFNIILFCFCSLWFFLAKRRQGRLGGFKLCFRCCIILVNNTPLSFLKTLPRIQALSLKKKKVYFVIIF